MRPLHHSYRERTQWVKAQYAQDLRRIRDVQEKLFRRARELKSQVERQELAASQQLHTGGDDAFCATRDDHVKRMAKDSSGMVKELAGNVAQLQGELDEMRQKMQRERTARIASETAKREFQDRLAEKEGLLKVHVNAPTEELERDMQIRLEAEVKRLTAFSTAKRQEVEDLQELGQESGLQLLAQY